MLTKNPAVTVRDSLLRTRCVLLCNGCVRFVIMVAGAVLDYLMTDAWVMLCDAEQKLLIKHL
jgi:hypothetical protein